MPTASKSALITRADLELINQSPGFKECFCRLVYAYNIAPETYRKPLLKKYSLQLFTNFIEILEQTKSSYSLSNRDKKEFNDLIRISVEKTQGPIFNKQYVSTVLACYIATGKSRPPKSLFLQEFKNEFNRFNKKSHLKELTYDQEMLLDAIKLDLDGAKIDFLTKFLNQVGHHQNYFTVKQLPIAIFLALFPVIFLRILTHYCGSILRYLFYLAPLPLAIAASIYHTTKSSNQDESFKEKIVFDIEIEDEKYFLVTQLSKNKPIQKQSSVNLMTIPQHNIQPRVEIDDPVARQEIKRKNEEARFQRLIRRKGLPFIAPEHSSDTTLESIDDTLTISDRIFFPVVVTKDDKFYVHLHEKIEYCIEPSERKSVLDYLQFQARTVGNSKSGSGLKFHKGPPIYYHLRVQGNAAKLRFTVIPIEIFGHTEKTWVINGCYLKRNNAQKTLELSKINYHSKLSDKELNEFVAGLTEDNNRQLSM